MAITHTAQVTGFDASGGDDFTTSSIDTTGANFLFASTHSYTGAGGYVAPTISDSKGNTWTALTFYTQSGYQLRLWYCENAITGTGHTFTISTTNSFSALTVHAFAGVATSSSLDQQTGAANSASTTHQPGSLTPSTDNCLVISACGSDGFNISSINSSFQTVDTTTTTGNTVNWTGGVKVTEGASYIIQTTAAAVNPTWTLGTSGFADVSLAVFKSAAASTSNIKSADGILLANIKSMDGIAIANIKSASGIANS